MPLIKEIVVKNGKSQTHRNRIIRNLEDEGYRFRHARKTRRGHMAMVFTPKGIPFLGYGVKPTDNPTASFQQQAERAERAIPPGT